MQVSGLVAQSTGIALALAGCAAVPAQLASNEEQLASARAAVAAAQTARAQDFAAQDLARAREKIELLGSYAVAREDRYVRWLGEQARIDAEVARVKALVLQRRAGRPL
jgi:hypothetical protein